MHGITAQTAILIAAAASSRLFSMTAFASREAPGIAHLRDVQPMHVAAYVEEIRERIAAPSVNLQLAAIRMLFD
jgi:hypothetical protein